MHALYFNTRFDRLQSLKIIEEQGKYTLCENENGTTFYAITRGLTKFEPKDILKKFKKYLKEHGYNFTEVWHTDYSGFFAFVTNEPDRAKFSNIRYNRPHDNWIVTIKESDIYKEKITNNFFK